jgi:hypothetical protein
MAVRIVRINRRCPKCGSPPRLRTVPEARRLIGQGNGEMVILTYQCHAPRCNVVYEIRAKHFHDM